jgi:hypothetical protein
MYMCELCGCKHLSLTAYVEQEKDGSYTYQALVDDTEGGVPCYCFECEDETMAYREVNDEIHI